MNRPAPTGIPRPCEWLMASAGLVVTAPLIVILAAAIRVTDGKPAFFRQDRIGMRGRSFSLLKLRTMRNSPTGLEITTAEDPRVTHLGRVLRRLKLDELPQLWNVVQGDMALVGPRPEVPRYVDLSDPLWQQVLDVRPGITDPTTLALHSEEELLASAEDPELYYRNELLPVKLAHSLRYLQERTWWTDVKVLLATARRVVFGGNTP